MVFRQDLPWASSWYEACIT